MFAKSYWKFFNHVVTVLRAISVYFFPFFFFCLGQSELKLTAGLLFLGEKDKLIQELTIEVRD